MTGSEDRATSNATVLDSHNVVRDGSWWTCRYCKGQWPYPAPLPDAPGPCVPRRWGDGQC